MIFDKSATCPVVIGHENDLQLLERLARQSNGGDGQIALISGEAGIGKSRLVKETKQRVSEHVLILEGQCFQTESTVPYAPFLDLFRNYLTTHPGQETAQALLSSSQLAKLLPELNAFFPERNPGSGPDPKQEKQRIFQAIAQTLTALANDHPLIIVIEDLHWSDSTSLEFLLLLARRVASQAILLLLTYRSEETTPELTHFLAELDRERLGTEISLAPMNSSEVDAMLRATLDLTTPISQEFLDTIYPLTEGNPFFIEEILKALIAEGDIFYVDGTWDRKEISQLRIPRTVQDAVQRRTQQLDKDSMQALTLAAVMGRRFDFRLLQELMAVDEATLIAILKQLVQAGLVVEESADQFAFRHALTREAIYTTLFVRERQTVHRTVGEAMQNLYGGSLEAHLADLSYHFYSGGIWQKALDYSRQAGDQARDLYAPREAIIYYTRALTSAQQMKLTIEPGLPGSRGHAYEMLGDFRSAREDFEAALTLAQERGDGASEWQTLIDLGFLWAERDYQRTGEYFRRAEELARTLNEPRLHAQSLNRLGNWSVNIGQTLQGLKSHYLALEIFDQERDEQGMANTHDLLGMAAMQHGDQIGSYDEYQYAIHLFRKLDDKQGLVLALVGASNSSYWDDTVPMPAQSRAENQGMAQEALNLARQIGWAAGQAFAEWGIAVGLANRGVFGEAQQHAREALRIATEIEHRQWQTGAHYALGHLFIFMLQPELAIQHLSDGLALARELGSAWWIGNLTADLTHACLLNKDVPRARATIDSVLIPDRDVHILIERRMLLAQANVLLAEGRPQEALQIAERLLDSDLALHQGQPIPALWKLKGEALIALDRSEAASQALEQARKGADQRQDLPCLWQIHSLLGQLHKQQKNNGKSSLEFTNARKVIQTLGATIEEELRRQGFISSASESLPREKTASRRQSDAEKFGGLTPRERDIARFLSQGKSNREIAERLVLSERTVENHVGNILAKLGFDSRAQVAVWAMEKGLGKEN